MATNVALVGSTGLVGSQILTSLANLPNVTTIHAFSRKELSGGPKVQGITSSDSEAWPTQYPSGAQLFLSALGTTRAQAGGFDKQRRIDYDLNLDLAKAAKAAGTKAYVLISSSGANSSSALGGYMKMKGELEDAIKALEFDHMIIVRPGLLVGSRNDTRTAEFALQKVASFMGSISGSKLKDFWAQDADTVARAAIKAGMDALEGKQAEKVRVLSQSDIIRLGRMEGKQ
ncbi:Protein fmp52, mitochondrial [Recurvomyces mirabilis]|uniref:Protein fmp52, mitochondrial n=1 Tax=Recurvomyces mirabilis TaxID=574656 RepID=A0AAE0WLP6_9PEZI|nr:Protein fmp52, mitochondrial [Recurvomyces mirabilis]KAK5152039.1 Protein fmp52, mitochondrial [Recurvomyces mirabilis]